MVRPGLGLAPGLDIHGLRRSYTTHMITIYGYDEKFISMQLGHVNTSTTTIYTLPSAVNGHGKPIGGHGTAR